MSIINHNTFDIVVIFFILFCFIMIVLLVLLLFFFAIPQTNAMMCTKEYAPVCGAAQVQCITSPCHDIETTFGNRCMLEAQNARYLYDGECKNP